MPTSDHSAAFAAIATQLLAEPDELVTAQTIVSKMLGLLPDADDVSLTIRTRTGHRTLASSGSGLAQEADALQYALHEGPCLDTADQGSWTRSGAVGHDRRWPAWGPRAGSLGVASLLSVQLLDNERPRGALNLCSRRSDRFSDHETVDLALIYAIHAANALSAARLATNLQTALSSRHRIGLAQGVLMERYGLDEHRSFELLRRISSTGQVKLRDVADHVVREGTLPAVPDGGVTTP